MKNYTTEIRKYHMFEKTTFVGRIKYYENDNFLFSESTGIHRIDEIDAMKDAEKLAKTMDWPL